MTDKSYDVLTFGDMCVDLILTGDDVVPEFGQVEKLVGNYQLEMGGSCCLFACQAARLGLRAGILGRVGADDFGRLVLRRLVECGVDTQHVIVDPGLKTGLGVALCSTKDRAMLTYLGSLPEIYPEDVSDDLLRGTRHVHHGSYFLHTNLRAAIPEIFRRARSFGATTSLDPNWDPDEAWTGNLMETLSLTDVFLPNEREARYISRKESLEEAIATFQAAGVAISVIKRGEDGAMLAAESQRHACVLPPVSGSDSTGAGDSFDAGFVTGWLRGLPLKTCLQIASFCGREVAAQVGGLRGQPDWKTVSGLIE